MTNSRSRSNSASEPSLESVLRSLSVYRKHVSSRSLLFFETFVLVATRSPVTLIEIAKYIDAEQATATDAVNKLGEGGPRYPKSFGAPPGLIGRVAHPEDARAKLAVLTPKGSQLVAEMRAALGHLR